jgi:hypothetical protein
LTTGPVDAATWARSQHDPLLRSTNALFSSSNARIERFLPDRRVELLKCRFGRMTDRHGGSWQLNLA